MSVKKLLFADPESCTGCLNCVLFCAQHNEGVSAPSAARIHIALDPFTGRYLSQYCLQCKKAACAEACPVGAIRRLPDQDYWSVNYDECIGCKACVNACPLGAMFLDPAEEKVLKCETCQGNPVCAEVCPTQALFWGDAADRANYRKNKIRKADTGEKGIQLQ
jgi:anaerobic carbon-monoxide dehydrogenase iron sulfur subunit